ncbi:MAG TPA: universal stress protein [Steroidobacteraceae bacterium]|nr:universal stress protein [Steroidobacteraceae bacterium]
MERPAHILVVIDPTATQHPALARARELARAFDARLELFVCYRQRESELHVDVLELEAMARELREAGIETSVDMSSAATLHVGIVRKVLRSRPSLVIKDTHPHSLLRRTWLVNTDWQLIRLCPVPVLFVRPGPWNDPPRFAAAVDIALPGEKPAELDHTLLSAAETFALATGGQPHAVHAYLPMAEFVARTSLAAVPMAAGVDPAAVMAGKENLAREEFAALLATHRVPEAQRHLVSGVPSDALIAFVRRQQIDVLVMGAYARGWVYNVMVGSTTERILDLLPCDVLVVKPASFECPLQLASPAESVARRA